MLKGVVTMGGRFFPPPGWMGDGKWSEWNILCDPTAGKMFYERRFANHVSYGLDVTERCTMGAAEVRARFVGIPVLRELLSMAEVWFSRSERITFHDPLAAVGIFDPGVCEYEKGTVSLEPSASDQAASRTYFTTGVDGGGPHTVARRVDVGRFFEGYFGVF